MSALPTDQGVRVHEPAPEARPLFGSALSRRIIDAGLALGFARVGIASISSFVEQKQRLKVFNERGYGGSMTYLSEPLIDGKCERGSSQRVLSGARSVISAALPYGRLNQRSVNSERNPEPWSPYVAAYARGADYHYVLRGLLEQLGEHIRDFVAVSYRTRACVDTAPLFERDIAVDAGVAFIGKNTLAIAPGVGSRFLLGELLLDLDLTPSSAPVSDGCGRCRSCLDVCPTGAFVADRLLDASKCISYLTIEHQGSIPRALRRAIGAHLFGCDLCQSVCPFNQSSKSPPAYAELTSNRYEDLQLEELLLIGSAAFKRLTRGSALRRINRGQLCRNVAIVMGNSGSASFVPVLRRALFEHPVDLVRDHAAWSLVELAQYHAVFDAQRTVDQVMEEGGEGAKRLRVELATRNEDISLNPAP